MMEERNMAVASVVEEEENWSELPEDLLVLVIRRLSSMPGGYHDRDRFRAVCESWRSAANKCPLPLDQFPKLMVPGTVDNIETRSLLRLNPNTGYFEKHEQDRPLKVPHGHICRGSAYGWLFLTDDNLDMKLLNPLSGDEIQLPPVAKLPATKNEKDRYPLCKWFVYKAVWSANPSVEPRPVVFIIHGGQHVPRLAFCKPGDEAWTPLKFPIRWCCHMDAIYHKDQFYILSYPGNVVAFDIGRRIDDNDHSVKTTVVATPRKGLVYTRPWHLVVLDGELVRFSLRGACFGDCCIDETKERMEKQSKRDGDTTDEDYTDADTDEDYAFDYADADEDTDTETVFPDSDDNNDDLDSESIDENVKEKENEKKDVKESESENEIEKENDKEKKGMNENENEKEKKDENEIENENENENDEDEDEDDEDEDNDNERRPSHHRRLTYGIKIRRFDESEKQWVKVESLGDKAVFLGYNTSFALSASDYPEGFCIPNSIYFTYGCSGGLGITDDNCYDMGIYNVKDKSIKPLFPKDDSQLTKPAPIWIVNAFDL